jgi:hypothetical protein
MDCGVRPKPALREGHLSISYRYRQSYRRARRDYAERRYGITTDTIWDRIWWVLPAAAAKQEISDARLAVEVATNLCAVFV